MDPSMHATCWIRASAPAPAPAHLETAPEAIGRGGRDARSHPPHGFHRGVAPRQQRAGGARLGQDLFECLGAQLLFGIVSDQDRVLSAGVRDLLAAGEGGGGADIQRQWPALVV